MVIAQDEDEPRNVMEALLGPVKENWTKKMDEEMEPMKSNQVWKFIDLQKRCKALKNKQVFKIKRKANGIIEKHKAKLVIKDYTQQE